MEGIGRQFCPHYGEVCYQKWSVQSKSFSRLLCVQTISERFPQASAGQTTHAEVEVYSQMIIEIRHVGMFDPI